MNKDTGRNARSAKLKFVPLTKDKWPDFVELFGPRGACGGCWCMFWRIEKPEFEKLKGEGLKRKMKKLVDGKQVPGILGYKDGQPFGWCSLQPREVFSTLKRSRVLKPVDDKPVWSIVCFYIGKGHRKQGMSLKLLEAALAHARKSGAACVEAYPIDKETQTADVFVYTGLASTFRKAGFQEVARNSKTRPIMRYHFSQA